MVQDRAFKSTCVERSSINGCHLFADLVIKDGNVLPDLISNDSQELATNADTALLEGALQKNYGVFLSPF